MRVKKENILRKSAISLLILFAGCIIVKEKEVNDNYIPVVALSQKPEIEMSEDIVRSKKGDMIAFLPKDWFLVDVGEEASSDVIAVAVNPDYTLSAVFSNLKMNINKEDVISKEGLLGLARLCFERHSKKTAGSITQEGKYKTMKLGNQSYVQFEFKGSDNPLAARSAVFISSLDEYYEFSLIPMNFRGKPVPVQTDIDRIFQSFLATIQF